MADTHVAREVPRYTPGAAGHSNTGNRLSFLKVRKELGWFVAYPSSQGRCDAASRHTQAGGVHRVCLTSPYPLLNASVRDITHEREASQRVRERENE